MKHLFTILFLILTFQGFCQTDSLNTDAEPIGGLNKLVLEYYKIDFTKEQKQLLLNKEIEFIYTIEKDGTPILEDIKGIEDKAILDSLRIASAKLPKFKPRKLNGEAVSSIALMKMEFPKYYKTYQTPGLQEAISYNQAAYEDFEYIHKSGERTDLLFGAVGNAFLGKPGNYLHPGGGIKTEVGYTGKKGIGGALVMSFYGNKQKKAYPLYSDREQNEAPPTMLLGIGLNKVFSQKERSEFIVQLDLHYAIQNVSSPVDDNDKDFIQLQGFSPGLVANYAIRLGKNQTYYYYANPAVLNNNLNFHVAVRPVLFNLKQATGVMVEAGISYRLSAHMVDEYRLKPGVKK